MITRIEKDEIGSMEIQASAYYGIKTLRNKDNFLITKLKVHKQMIRSLALVKKACALANYDAKRLNEAQKDAIIKACDEIYNGRFNNQFITDAIQGGSCVAFNFNMDEVIANRANEILGGKLGEYKYVNPYDDVDLFQSPNDVIPTAAKHALIVLIKNLTVEYKKIKKAFLDKAKKYRSVYKVGRVDLQDSLPVSFGKIFEAYGISLERDMVRIESISDNLKIVNLGTGSLGIAYYQADTYVNTIINYFNELTRIEFRHPEQYLDIARNIDIFGCLSKALSQAATNLSKITSDIRLMASGPKAGFNEIILPSYEKVNGFNVSNHSQAVPEIINQVCFQIIGKDKTIDLAIISGEQEVNAFTSIIYANLFDSIEYLTRALVVFREYCIKDLSVNEEHCYNALKESLGVVVGLLKYVEYKECVSIFREANKTNKTIKEVCLSRKILDEKILDKVLDPKNFGKK